ncbi:flagellar basal body-associated FliL family protein, partial [Salmonella enterica]|uniref:flagellar basal body-associated FliL family protein n=1 Tax=Salmonella enterica TaxID=28901 RepID=UPI00356B727D
DLTCSASVSSCLIAAELSTEAGKQKLIAAIKETLAAPLVAGQPKQVVTDVLYTAFILR